MRTFSRSLTALLAVALVSLAAACGDGDSASETAATATTAPEDLRASDAAVTTGLREINQLGRDIAGAVVAGELERAQGLVEHIEPVWEPVEGTVKANDEDVYIALEDAFAAIGLAVDDGDKVKAEKAADAISAAVNAYLEAYPG